MQGKFLSSLGLSSIICETDELDDCQSNNEEWLMFMIQANWEAEIGGVKFKASPGKKLVRPHSNKQIGYGGTNLQSQLRGRLM
jgi:hypothetical protein